MSRPQNPRAPRTATFLLGVATVVVAFAAGLVMAPKVAFAATYTVNSTADAVSAGAPDGICDAGGSICTLREAIKEANNTPGHDTIVLPSGTYTLSLGPREGAASYNIAVGDMDVLDGVTITGAGGNRDGDPNATIIQAGTTSTNGIDRVFDVQIAAGKDTTVTFEALTVRYGRGADLGFGGGINLVQPASSPSPATLWVYNSIVTQNWTGKSGGGISVANASTSQAGVKLRVEKSAITNNTAGQGNDGSGGMIGGLGGGIEVGSRLAFEMIDSRVSNNTAQGGTLYSGDGGGMDIWDDGLSGLPSSITGSIIADNDSLGTAIARGGGSYIGRQMSLSNTTVSGNHADYDGGGLYASQLTGWTFTMTNVTISGNDSNAAGGGLMLTPENANAGPDIKIVNTTITNNRANLNNTGEPNGTPETGGGIYISPDGHGLPKLYNTIVAGNFLGSAASVSEIANTVDFANSFNNLVGTTGSGGMANGTNANKVGITDARLGGLANNGTSGLPSHVGQRQTHTLLSGSPALDAGTNTAPGLPATDARGTGFGRTLDAADANTTATVDIGALEMHPVVEDIADQSMLQDTSKSILFNLGDAGLGFTSITAMSSNATLVPNNAANLSISAGSSASNRNLNITPAVGTYGTATITVTATSVYNGVTQTSTDTFVLTVVRRPDLTVTKSHTGNFRQGDTGKTYTLTVSNAAGAGNSLLPGDPLLPSVTKIHVTDTLPTGLTPTAASGGANWLCTVAGQTVDCDYQQVLNAGASAPSITVTVNVAYDAGPSLTNSATVSGGGDNTTGNNTANDPTTVIQTADLTVSSSHTDPFKQGETGKTYTLVVGNAGPGPTDAAFSVADTLPAGLTPTAASGAAGEGWTCSITGQTVTCNRSTVLAKDATSTITVTVNVARDAGASLTNTASVSGGGELAQRASNNSASDATTITQMPDLTVAKTAVGTFRQGQSASYTLAVTNSGFAATDGSTVTVTDTLPVGLTYVGFSGTGWTCTASGQAVTCTSTDVVAGGNTPFAQMNLDVNVAGNAPTSVSNTASVSGGGEIWTANDSASASTTVVLAPDLTIAKSHTGNFTQGDTGKTYTITVANKAGKGPTFGIVTVADTLPAGLTATAISGTGWTCDLPTLSCTRSDALAGGSSYPVITVTVDVAANAGPSVTNTAAVSGGSELSTTLSDNTASDPTTINQLADLTVTSSHTDPFQQGQTGAQYTLTVKNIGTGQTDGSTVTVTDTLPTGLTPTGVTSTGSSCSYAGQTVTCTLATVLLQNDTFTITITVNVADNAAASVTNTAMISGGGEPAGKTGNNTATDVTNITQLPDLTVTKMHAGNFRQGSAGTYTIRVTNSGSAPTDGSAVTVADTLPTGMTATAMSGTGWTCDLPTLTCTRSDALAASQSYPDITLTVSVAGNAAASLTNTVAVSGGGEMKTSNNVASDPTTVDLVADLTVVKSHTGNFTQGQTGTYTITVHNGGQGPTVGAVRVTEAPEAGLTVTGMSGTGWTCDLPTLTCTRSDALAASSSYPDITVTVSVAATAPPSLTNSVTVDGGGELKTDNNSASDTTTINQLPDLVINKGHTGDFTQGQQGATYTLTVTNQSTGLTSGTVTVTDTLPAGLTAPAMSGTGWTCDLPTLTCTRSEVLAGGASYPDITLTVNVSATAPASLTNQAAVAGGGDTVTTNNTDSDATTIIQAPDLTIDKSHSGTFQRGQKGAVYKITVGNAGGLPTSGTVTVTDTLPTGLTAKGWSGTGWTCTISGQTVTCTTPDVLQAGQSYPVITLTVAVAVDAQATLTNVAEVMGGGQLNTANDSDSDETSVVAESDLTITKTHTDDFTQGQPGAYTLTVHNGGPGPTKGTVTVTDTLPQGLSYVSAIGTHWTCSAEGQTVTCTSTDEVASGSPYPPITLTVSVAESVPPTITNEAEVSGGGELITDNNTASDEARVIQLVDLTIAKTHDYHFTQGQTGATYTLTVTNKGILPSHGEVRVTEALPQGLTPTAATMSGTGWTCDQNTLTCTRFDALAPDDGTINWKITVTVDVAADGAPTVTNVAEVSGGGDYSPANNKASDPTTVIQVADLVIVKSHTGSFRQGQTDAVYTLVVSNVGPGDTAGTVTVTDTLPQGLTATDLIYDTPWDCDIGSLTCFRSDKLAPGQSYSPITLKVKVAVDAQDKVTNTAAVSGGGQIKLDNDSASDLADVVQVADLTLTKLHHGNFVKGRTGTYSLTVKNEGTGPTDAPVTVTDTLPVGLTATAMSGSGWTCDLSTVSCTRSDVLASGGTYPPILLNVRVAPNALAELINQAQVSGGGQAKLSNDTASDPTRVVPPPHDAFFVTITAPVTVTRENSVTVHGTANPGNFVSVNGITVQADHGANWSATLPLAEGANVITATNSVVSDSVTVIRDTVPPPVSLTASATTTDQETVELTATSEEGARINIEGKPVSRLRVHLTPGENTFTATATDQAGNTATATVTVVRTTQPEHGTPPETPVPPQPQPPGLPFKDVEGHWALPSIIRMVDQGVVNGYEDDTFRPEASVNRLEFAVMVARLLQLAPADQPLSFTDSDRIPGWARAQMSAAVQAGIITGRPDGSFDPDAFVIRAEVAVMLVRAMRARGLDIAPGTGRFADQIPAWAREQVLAAARYGLVTGYEDGSFRAGNTATRAEAVTMLNRLLDVLSR